MPARPSPVPPATADVSFPFSQVRLGDVITLPGGRQVTVRARERMPIPYGPMAGFFVLEELDLLLSVPPQPSLSPALFEACPRMPEKVKRGVEVYRGEMNYWSPHLPAAADAMGALQFRVVDVPGELHPAVIVYRTGEPIVFVHTRDVDADGLGLLAMHVGDEWAERYTRRASVLTPQPQQTPERAPDRRQAKPAGRRGVLARLVGR